MNLPNPPPKYSAEDQGQLRTAIAQEDLRNVKKGSNIELSKGTHVFLRSANGSRWKISVDNTGVLSAVSA